MTSHSTMDYCHYLYVIPLYVWCRDIDMTAVNISLSSDKGSSHYHDNNSDVTDNMGEKIQRYNIDMLKFKNCSCNYFYYG